MAIGMMLTFLSHGFLMKYLSKKYPSRFDSGIDYIRTAHKRIINIFGTIVTGLYTPVFSTALEPFDCRLQSDGSYVMGKNPSQNCYDFRWKANSPVFISLLILYGFFLPFGVAYGLYRKRNERYSQDFQFKYSVFINAYDPRTYWWEVVSLLKRASFFLVTGFFYNLSQSTRFISAIAVLFLFLTLELTFMPYSNRYLNVFSQGWTMIAISVLASNALLFSYTSLPERTRNAFDIILVLIIIISLLWTLIFIGIRILKRERRYSVTEETLSRFSADEQLELYSALFKHESINGNMVVLEHQFMKELYGPAYEILGRKMLGYEKFDVLELKRKKIASLPLRVRQLFFPYKHVQRRFIELNKNNLENMGTVAGLSVLPINSFKFVQNSTNNSFPNGSTTGTTKHLQSPLEYQSVDENIQRPSAGTDNPNPNLNLQGSMDSISRPSAMHSIPRPSGNSPIDQKDNSGMWRQPSGIQLVDLDVTSKSLSV
jgi:hypothetical protein